jgi:molecular chaperone Hsp33
MRETDSLRRFLFEETPLRGHWVKLEDAWSQARAHQDHPPAVASLLGQALSASALLAACLKFRGTLTLQVRSQGAVPLLIVQCTHDRQLRGVAQVREGAVIAGEADLAALAGSGTLVVTLDNHDGGEPWQGIVPLAGDSLARCLEGYFETSEQLPTRLILAADDWRAGGVLLQKLPQAQSAGEGARGRMLEIWDECSLLLDTLGGRELLDTEPQLLLQRLFSAHDVRLFEADPVRFSCRCSQVRVNSLLLTLGEDEVKEILDEQGSVAITCEFCNRQYRYDAIDAAQVFADAPAPDLPGSVN